MDNLVSLSCSGESLEKTLSIYYLTLQSNEVFYNQYKVMLYFGHNLPKKNRNSTPHGSIGFYNTYLSDCAQIPSCNFDYLYANRQDILQKLINQKHITCRSAEKMVDNKDRYLFFLKNLPIEYLYPEYHSMLSIKASECLNIYKIVPLFFEKNYMEIISKIHKSRDKYSIYSLDYCGNIGHYYLNYVDVKQMSHLFSDLGKQSVLSGNSAILLEQIGNRISEKSVVGYREHKTNLRPYRDYALTKLIAVHNSILEPSNVGLYKIFDEYRNIATEEQANMVYAKAFKNFILYNRFSLGL